MKKAFCFKFDTSLGMAQDIETGANCEAFCKVTLDLKNPPSAETDKEASEGVRRMVSNSMGVDFNLVHIITEEEYILEVEEEV